MKKLILTLLGVASLATTGFSQYFGQYFYGPTGQLEGSAYPNIGIGGYHYYGPYGQFMGNSFPSWGQGYDFYGPTGGYLGHSTGGYLLPNYLDDDSD